MLWCSCPVSMVLSHILTPVILCPAHTAHVLTLQTQANLSDKVSATPEVVDKGLGCKSGWREGME